MKVRDLIERLMELEVQLREELGDDTEPEVVAAYQPTYPLAGSIQGACVLQEDEDGEPVLANGSPVVWIAIGGHPAHLNPYAPRRVFEEAE
jgi:hypothetical protein